MPVIKHAPEDISRLSIAPDLAIRLKSPGSSQARIEPRLRAEKLVWAANGDITSLHLSYIYGYRSGIAEANDLDGPKIGDEVTLVDTVDGSLWFSGHIVKDCLEITSSPDNQCRSLIAHGAELQLKALALHGQWCKTASIDASEISGELTSSQRIRENVFTSDLPLVFNIDGRPNASMSSSGKFWQLSDSGKCDDFSACVFEPPGRIVNNADGRVIEAAYWDAYTALRSLVEYVDNYNIVSPNTDWQSIKKDIGSLVLPEVDIEGDDLCTAITKILQPVGYGFCLLPWNGNYDFRDADFGHILEVFPLAGYQNGVSMPVLARNDSDIDTASVMDIKFELDSSSVANDVRVVGNMQNIGVCLEFTPNAFSRDLHPAWNTSIYDLDDYAHSGYVVEMDGLPENSISETDAGVFLERYCRGGELNTQYFHVFRSFVWNEDGAFSSTAGTMPDLSQLFGENYTRRPRPVGKSFLAAENGNGTSVMPAWVELGIDGDDQSWIPLPQTSVMSDYGGFTINIARLDKYYPYARAGDLLREKYYLGPGKFSLATLIYNALRNDGGEDDYAARFRLIGSVQADMAASGAANFDNSGNWPFKSQRVIYNPRRFACQKLDSSANPHSMDVLSRDDSDAAASYAANIKRSMTPAVRRGCIRLYNLHRGYKPGMIIDHTAGRRITLGDSGAGEAVRVNRICWDFSEKGHRTELYLQNADNQG